MSVTPLGKENFISSNKRQKTTHSFRVPDRFKLQFYLFKAIKKEIFRNIWESGYGYNLKPIGDDETLWEEFPSCNFKSWVLEHRDQITTLVLSQKGLTKLPEELFLLTNLKVLGLAQNAFQELPPELFELKSLEKLDLSDNQLTVLPKAMEKLTNLKGLGLNSNPIESFDLSLPRLESLGLSHTGLKEIPNLRDTSLKTLRFIGNQVKEVDVACLPASIKILRISENQIERLSGPFKELENLEFFSLNSNRLTALPASFSSLPKLRILEMNENAFEEVPDVLSKLPQLDQLYLSQNRVRVLPRWIMSLKEYSVETALLQGFLKV